MATAALNQHECPVCSEDYTNPKLLPCTHLMCRRCVISRLSKDNQGDCPLCRVPIFPASNGDQGDLCNAVDALPTDLITAAAVESQHILRSPNRCVCNDSTEAKFLCLQCRLKLCSFCAKSHLKSPAIQHHVVEELDDVSAEKLSEFYHSPCNSHGSKPAELYCRPHRELICMLCASSVHRQCLNVGEIGKEAKLQREELKKQIERFKEKEKDIVAKIQDLDGQIADGKAKFQMMRDEIKATFDDLKQTVEAQQQKLTRDLDQREDAYFAEKKAPRAELDMHRELLSSHINIMGEVASASDDLLLGMLNKLKSRLDNLESQELRDEADIGSIELESISLDADLIADLKRLIYKLGEVGDQSSVCSLCGEQKPGFGGPEYAAIMKVGDRVRRGKDWTQVFGYQDGYPPGMGTITSINVDALETGFAVGVTWDSGGAYQYRMGWNNKYDLQLAQCSQPLQSEPRKDSDSDSDTHSFTSDET